jgi:hypothetical protein
LGIRGKVFEGFKFSEVFHKLSYEIDDIASTIIELLSQMSFDEAIEAYFL